MHRYASSRNQYYKILARLKTTSYVQKHYLNKNPQSTNFAKRG